MSKRTTAAEVKSIMDTGLSDVDIEQIIEMANKMVTNTLGSSSLTAAELADIET